MVDPFCLGSWDAFCNSCVTQNSGFADLDCQFCNESGFAEESSNF